MTSGVAGLVAAYAPPDVRDDLLAGLRADTLDRGIDGSMFLTEREGGSDLGNTVHCVARDLGDGRVQINGEKWFCSNIDGEAIVLLARPEGRDGGLGRARALSRSRAPRRRGRNHFTMRRLKDKLGTKSVPTGEVEFHGAIGYALRDQHGDATARSDAGGLNRMMEMVNGSRFGVAMMGLGIARRSFLEAVIWAHHRACEGRPARRPARSSASSSSTCRPSSKPRSRSGSSAPRRPGVSYGDRLRRILVPAAKVRLCRFGVEAASAAVELYGGNGYCEDWGLTRLLRDAQCHPIWEGSENICVLDVLRAIRRDAAHEAVLARIDDALATASGAPAFAGEAIAAVTRSATPSRDASMPCWRWSATSPRPGARCWRARSSARSRPRSCSSAHPATPAKRCVAVRYTRRHLIPDAQWGDHIAGTVARELLGYDEIDEETAAKAAA